MLSRESHSSRGLDHFRRLDVGGLLNVDANDDRALLRNLQREMPADAIAGSRYQANLAFYPVFLPRDKHSNKTTKIGETGTETEANKLHYTITFLIL